MGSANEVQCGRCYKGIVVINLTIHIVHREEGAEQETKQSNIFRDIRAGFFVWLLGTRGIPAGYALAMTRVWANKPEV